MVLKSTLYGLVDSLPNCMSGIGKQKTLRKFEQAVTFILEHCELELVTVVVWKDQDNGRFYVINEVWFFLITSGFGFGFVWFFCNTPWIFLKLEVQVDF